MALSVPKATFPRRRDFNGFAVPIFVTISMTSSYSSEPNDLMPHSSNCWTPRPMTDAYRIQRVVARGLGS
jgi:hypothetical protein